LPRLACRVADSSTVWRRLFLDISVRLSSMAMMSPAQDPGSCQLCQNKICIPVSVVMLIKKEKRKRKLRLAAIMQRASGGGSPELVVVLLSKQAHCML